MKKELFIVENSVTSVDSEIQGMIYNFRDKYIMVDSDLAILYETTTGALNQAAKRNRDRFPDDFRFQLTKEEYDNLKSQSVISSLQ